MKCESLNLGNGYSAIVCSRGQRAKPCKTCGQPSTKLCDELLGPGAKSKTCDASMCDRCATEIGADRHLCPPHSKRRDERAQADAWLADVIVAESFETTRDEADAMERGVPSRAAAETENHARAPFSRCTAKRAGEPGVGGSVACICCNCNGHELVDGVCRFCGGFGDRAPEDVCTGCEKHTTAHGDRCVYQPMPIEHRALVRGMIMMRLCTWCDRVAYFYPSSESPRCECGHKAQPLAYWVCNRRHGGLPCSAPQERGGCWLNAHLGTFEPLPAELDAVERTRVAASTPQDLYPIDPPSTREQRAASTPISDKVRHVRRAGQTRDHGCYWPGCEAQCPPAQWGCRRHWYMLPKFLRDKIWRAYVPGQETTLTPSRTYVEVAREVQTWIRLNHPETRNIEWVDVDAGPH